jgi:hypothetical protein
MCWVVLFYQSCNVLSNIIYDAKLIDTLLARYTLLLLRSKKGKFLVTVSQKERDHWEDQDVGGWTILKWIGMGWYGLD